MTIRPFARTSPTSSGPKGEQPPSAAETTMVTPVGTPAPSVPSVSPPSVRWEHPLERVEEIASPPRRPRLPWLRRRKVLVWAGVVLVVLGALAGFGVWMALGLRDSARDVKTQATAAEDELTAFRTVAGSDPTAASRHLDAAALHLATARRSSRTTQMRIAGVLPWAKIPVSDLGHLLDAADATVSAGHYALDVSGAIKPVPGSSQQPLYADHVFSLPVVQQTAVKAQQISSLMAGAEQDLLEVDGTGPKEQEVPGIRDRALDQVRSLRKQMEQALPLLRLLPGVLGADTPRTYLVTVLNQAEMRPSGGAPLSVATLTLDKGVMTQGAAQSTSDVKFPNGLAQGAGKGFINAPVPWKPAVADPFFSGQRVKGKTYTPFVNANTDPDFRVSGQNLALAWQGGTGQHIDGVIALDMNAVRELLRVTGGVDAAGYGQVNDQNVAQLLLANVYAEADSPQRHLLNAALMGGLVQRLSEGGGLTDKAKALFASAPGRHFQIWMADPSVQQFISGAGLSGAVAAPATTGDRIALFNQNLKGAKVDALQQRTVDEIITMQADGSAKVQRTVTQSNGAIDRSGKMLEYGELSGFARDSLVTVLPTGASDVTTPPAPAKPQQGATQVLGKRQVLAVGGLSYLRQPVQIAPGSTGTWPVTFTIPKAAVAEGDGMTLQVAYDANNDLTPVRTRTVVIPPPGWRVTGGTGVQVASGQGVLDVALDRTQTLSVVLSRG
ncbi:uncharacterized protein DUF4012 [Motilibacter rhizosphaerae]|uniref:Uncharacterized protein DUF4012 n=1 Tax=Motilibacter rhizosphaerae TaxID=598652 RepID=A0A4Q7NVR5_9ACTN|nr:DUF4012 domain-containing protein [Motilibacter rhizosphaerae]RZS91275.1 uncharacterized protein DUF4012 [Motilibacter rhizosphaerae]